MASFDPITNARLLACDQARECLARTRKIMARRYPNWELPRGNPLSNDHARAVFTSPIRSQYILFQRHMAKEIEGRIFAKIKARDDVSFYEPETRPAHYTLAAVA